MKYETYGSATGISDIPDILSNYFGYQSSKCIWRDTFETYSDEEWLKMVCEELLEGNKEEKMAMPMFARTFNELSKEDQDEIINLIKFKRLYKDKKISE